MAICNNCGRKYSRFLTPVSAKGVCSECFEAQLEAEARVEASPPPLPPSPPQTRPAAQTADSAGRGEAMFIVEFIFPYRLHRLSYFLRLVVVHLLWGFVYRYNGTMDSPLWLSALVALPTYTLFFVLLPRLRDVGMSAWWLLTAVIPGVVMLLVIILLFRAPEYQYNSQDAEESRT